MKPETVVAATDFLLGAAALAGSFRLARAAARPRQRSVRFWAAGFAAIAAAALSGGSWHALVPRLPAIAATLLWGATLSAAGLAAFLLLAGAAYASVGRRVAKFIVAAASVKLALYLAWSLPTDSFAPVVVDTGITLAAILVLQVLALVRWKAASAPWILGGIAISAAAAAVEAIRPALPGPFGPDAVYHLVQLAGLCFFYRGGRLFADR